MVIILLLKGQVHKNGLKYFVVKSIAVKQFVGTPLFNDIVKISICVLISYYWYTYFVASKMLRNFSFVVYVIYKLPTRYYFNKSDDVEQCISKFVYSIHRLLYTITVFTDSNTMVKAIFIVSIYMFRFYNNCFVHYDFKCRRSNFITLKNNCAVHCYSGIT